MLESVRLATKGETAESIARFYLAYAGSVLHVNEPPTQNTTSLREGKSKHHGDEDLELTKNQETETAIDRGRISVTGRDLERQHTMALSLRRMVFHNVELHPRPFRCRLHCSPSMLFQMIAAQLASAAFLVAGGEPAMSKSQDRRGLSATYQRSLTRLARNKDSIHFHTDALIIE